MSLGEIVKRIIDTLGQDYPVYVDDTNIYVCGADVSMVAGLPESLKREISKVNYNITSVPLSAVRKVGMQSYRMG